MCVVINLYHVHVHATLHVCTCVHVHVHMYMYAIDNVHVKLVSKEFTYHDSIVQLRKSLHTCML